MHDDAKSQGISRDGIDLVDHETIFNKQRFCLTCIISLWAVDKQPKYGYIILST